MVRSLSRARFACLGLACAGLLSAFGAYQARGADLDPQSLIGEWQGTWSLASSRGTTGNYYITIKKVEGEKVYGRSERPAAGRTPEFNWNFVGTLAGNVVTVKASDLAMELNVNGTSMTGWSLARGNRYDLNLTKK